MEIWLQWLYPILLKQKDSKCMHSKLNYISGIQKFKYLEVDKSTEVVSRVTPSNIIVFVVEGKVQISCDTFIDQVVGKNEMFFLPKQSLSHACYLSQSKLLFFIFDSIICPVNKQLLQSSFNLCKQVEYQFEPLVMKKPLKTFTDAMIQALDMGFTSDFYYKLKHLELFHFLVQSYKKEELVQFFYPIICQNIDFKTQVIEGYKQDETLDGLVKFCCMSKSSFRKQFKEYFGMSVYQWILKQRCKKISYLAALPNASIKGIMTELNFDSPSHFNRFCRRHFNCTPKDLISRLSQKVEL